MSSVTTCEVTTVSNTEPPCESEKDLESISSDDLESENKLENSSEVTTVSKPELSFHFESEKNVLNISSDGSENKPSIGKNQSTKALEKAKNLFAGDTVCLLDTNHSPSKSVLLNSDYQVLELSQISDECEDETKEKSFGDETAAILNDNDIQKEPENQSHDVEATSAVSWLKDNQHSFEEKSDKRSDGDNSPLRTFKNFSKVDSFKTLRSLLELNTNRVQNAKHFSIKRDKSLILKEDKGEISIPDDEKLKRCNFTKNVRKSCKTSKSKLKISINSVDEDFLCTPNSNRDHESSKTCIIILDESNDGNISDSVIPSKDKSSNEIKVMKSDNGSPSKKSIVSGSASVPKEVTLDSAQNVTPKAEVNFKNSTPMKMKPSSSEECEVIDLEYGDSRPKDSDSAKENDFSGFSTSSRTSSIVELDDESNENREGCTLNLECEDDQNDCLQVVQISSTTIDGDMVNNKNNTVISSNTELAKDGPNSLIFSEISTNDQKLETGPNKSETAIEPKLLNESSILPDDGESYNSIENPQMEVSLDTSNISSEKIDNVQESLSDINEILPADNTTSTSIPIPKSVKNSSSSKELKSIDSKELLESSHKSSNLELIEKTHSKLPLSKDIYSTIFAKEMKLVLKRCDEPEKLPELPFKILEIKLEKSYDTEFGFSGISNTKFSDFESERVGKSKENQTKDSGLKCLGNNDVPVFGERYTGSNFVDFSVVSLNSGGGKATEIISKSSKDITTYQNSNKMLNIDDRDEPPKVDSGSNKPRKKIKKRGRFFPKSKASSLLNRKRFTSAPALKKGSRKRNLNDTGFSVSESSNLNDLISTKSEKNVYITRPVKKETNEDKKGTSTCVTKISVNVTSHPKSLSEKRPFNKGKGSSGIGIKIPELIQQGKIHKHKEKETSSSDLSDVDTSKATKFKTVLRVTKPFRQDKKVTKKGSSDGITKVNSSASKERKSSATKSFTKGKIMAGSEVAISKAELIKQTQEHKKRKYVDSSYSEESYVETPDRVTSPFGQNRKTIKKNSSNVSKVSSSTTNELKSFAASTNAELIKQARVHNKHEYVKSSDSHESDLDMETPERVTSPFEQNKNTIKKDSTNNVTKVSSSATNERRSFAAREINEPNETKSSTSTTTESKKVLEKKAFVKEKISAKSESGYPVRNSSIRIASKKSKNDSLRRRGRSKQVSSVISETLSVPTISNEDFPDWETCKKRKINIEDDMEEWDTRGSKRTINMEIEDGEIIRDSSSYSSPKPKRMKWEDKLSDTNTNISDLKENRKSNILVKDNSGKTITLVNSCHGVKSKVKELDFSSGNNLGKSTISSLKCSPAKKPDLSELESSDSVNTDTTSTSPSPKCKTVQERQPENKVNAELGMNLDSLISSSLKKMSQGNTSSEREDDKSRFNCIMCDRTFRKRSKLKKHFKRHIMKMVRSETLLKKHYKCYFCNEKLHSRHAWKNHIQSKHAKIENIKYEHVCETCSEEFTSLVDLKVHEKIAHQISEENEESGSLIEELAKPVTAAVSPRKVSLGKIDNTDEEKVRKPNKTWRKFQCLLCSRSFLTNQAFSSHKKVHLVPTATATNISLVENNSKTGHTCPECPRSFSSHKALFTHSRVHGKLHLLPNQPSSTTISAALGQEDLEKPNICPKCSKSFSSPEAMAVHHNRAHGKSLSNPPSTTATSATLEKEDSENDNTCSKCSKSFYSHQALAVHHYDAHVKLLLKEPSESSVDDLTCSKCSKTFRTQHGLSMHNVRTHGISFPKKPNATTLDDNSSVEEYPCKICSKSFISQGALNGHTLKMHRINFEVTTKEIPTRSETLNLHGKSLSKPNANILDDNSSVEDYLCSKCPKSFVSQKALTGHNLNAHRNVNEVDLNEISTKSETVKLFSCKMCSQRFTTFTLLTMHINKTHPNFQPMDNVKISPNKDSDEKNYCKQCGKQFNHPHGLLIHNSIAHGIRGKRHNQTLKHKMSSPTGSRAATKTGSPGKKNSSKDLFCYICFKRFHTRLSLTIHNDKEHLSEHLESESTSAVLPVKTAKNMSCPICFEELFSVSELLAHVQNMHPE